MAIGLLNSVEVQTLTRIKAPKRRCEFLFGRTILRCLLARYVGTVAADILIEQDSHGKPWAHTLDHREMPTFNVSHSGDVLAIALCANGEIGVDVEQTNAHLKIDIKQIAQSNFASDECLLLKTLPPEQRLDSFLRIWTLKEAVLKAIGVGLYHPLNQINVAEPAVRYRILLNNAGKNVYLEAEHFQSRAMSFHVTIARVGALGVVSIFDNMLEGKYASEMISFEHKRRTAVTGSQK
uniref:Uncharacterized protein n=1 Tax=mine drainage metagenome TaxID=410659 RepID=E6QPP6_9ZZZZ